MSIQAVDPAAHQAINEIIQKGGQALYDTYISQKIPNHTHQNIHKYLYQTTRVAYTQEPRKNTLRRQGQPKAILIDRLAPNKIQKRPKSQQSNLPRKLQISGLLNKTQQKIEKKNFGSFTERKQRNSQDREIKNKPGFCFKLGCEKLNPEDLKNQQKLRRNKFQKEAEIVREKEKESKQNDEKAWRKRRLQYKIEELTSLGMKYGFDDNGDLIAPSQKEIKQSKHESQYKKVNSKSQNAQKVLNMKYQTLNLVSVNRYHQEQEYQVSGRKRGFVSSKFYKKVKMTDRQYNNQNSRQVTAIPFLNLSSGITIIEKQKNVTASKSQEPSKKREEFIRESQTSAFKSYLPEDDRYSTAYNTISVDRPYTTAHCDRMKRTAETRSMRQSSDKKSILWRPQTSNNTCRLSINNMELAKEFVRQ